MNINIRKAGNEDIDQLAIMLADLFSIEDDFEIDDAKQMKALEMIIESTTGGIILIAESELRITGMVNLQKIVSTAAGGFSILLEDLYVIPEFRNKGIGGMLLNQALKWGREQGAFRIQLAADQRNMTAEIFYTRRSFTKSNMVFYYKAV